MRLWPLPRQSAADRKIGSAISAAVRLNGTENRRQTSVNLARLD
jgi:hypothetical protein